MAGAAPDRVAFHVNGCPVETSADGDVPLIAVLRNELGLAGTRFGCGHERCGACMVLLDGAPTYACACPAWSVAGRAVSTVEGLAAEGDTLIQAFLDEQAGQCGYCLSGILISARALLDRNPRADRAAVLAALEPHLCRCGAHNGIIGAIAERSVSRDTEKQVSSSEDDVLQEIRALAARLERLEDALTALTEESTT